MDSTQELSTPSEALRGDLKDEQAEGNGKGRVTLEKLLKPSEMFKRLEPTQEKIKEIARHLMENKYSLSDELRDYDIIHSILRKYMTSDVCVFYEIGDMDGIFGFTDIIPGWKAHVVFELINPKIWGKQLVRESRELIDLVMKSGDLIKLSSQTADKRIERMAKMIGFHLEGIRELEFSWDKKPYPIYLIGRFK